MSESQTKPADSNVAQLPSKASFKKIGDCKSLGEAFETKDLRDRIAATIPKHMDPDTMLRAFIQASSRTPLIFKCDMRQAIGAFMSLSYLGLVPGTILAHAHLIPFAFKQRWNPKTRQKEDGYDLTVIIGYPGLVDLAHRSGFVRDLQTGIVLPGEHFEAQKGTDKYLIHKPQIDVFNPAAMPRCAYAVASLVEQGTEFEVMPWGEVMGIRDRSQAYRRALAAKNEAEEKGRRPPSTWTDAPWVAHERQMGRKTALRRLAGLLPKCPELRAGIGLDDAHDAGKRLDFGPVIDGTATPWDGIPEVNENPDEGGPPDPGTAHTDRRPPVDQSASQQNPKTRPARQQRQQTSTAETQQSSPKPPPATTPAAKTPPAFEAVMISAWGEIGAETFTDPVEFARTLVDEYRRIGANATDAANLIEHNADAIDQARANAEAAQLLRALDEPPPAEDQGGDSGEDGADDGYDPDDPGAEEEQTESESGTPDSRGHTPLTYAAIDVPKANGRPSWPTWLALLRDELATVEDIDLLAFTEAQRGRLAECPLAQRALAVQAITQRFAKVGRTPPGYLAELIAMPTQRQKDEKWLADRLADLKAIGDELDEGKGPAARMHFDAMVRSTATRTVMARLRTDDAELFGRADVAFGDLHKKLPPAPGEPQ